MSKLNVFIDGTWLFKVVEGNVFNRFVERPDLFDIDFSKLNRLMIDHVRRQRPDCTEMGECHFVTSIFNLPPDFDKWVGKVITHPYGGQSITVYPKNIVETKKSIQRRTEFAQNAIDAGYDTRDIFHIDLQEWILLNILHSELRYQEKQVDTTVVALLVKSVFMNSGDCFALVAGDADILPAISVAFPQFTKNVFPVLTSANERDGRNRQTSFKYWEFDFEIDTLILQNNVGDIMKGNVYRCTECQKFFTTINPIPDDKIKSGLILPRCKQHK